MTFWDLKKWSYVSERSPRRVVSQHRFDCISRLDDDTIFQGFTFVSKMKKNTKNTNTNFISGSLLSTLYFNKIDQLLVADIDICAIIIFTLKHQNEDLQKKIMCAIKMYRKNCRISANYMIPI